MPFVRLPAVPAPHAELPSLLAKHPDTPAGELFEPYRKFEASVRELFAQEPGHPALQDQYVNVVPLFAENNPAVTIRARNLEAESDEEKSKYIMALPDENRHPNGAAATVSSLKDFQNNFFMFSESALSDIDWSNIVAAGSSVVNCLLPIPDEYSKSKRALREYYHEKFCPASDVDLFLYGLGEAEAIEKIKDIETKVRDSILAETTTVRTKHAITICSQYPTRHIQIVLRIYKSISEILTGFDIDSSGAAYDGKQVYCTPRALQSYVTQINHIDLSRRSPSYENRLSKYSHRNFEIHWPELDRSRIDPTIFDRSFQRTLGLARLLILEKLPTPDARSQYATQRRKERGRPPLPEQDDTDAHGGNIKDNFEDEVAEWLIQDAVSNYSTFVIPYGRKYNAKKIEKLCYTQDLLLNAEWNQKHDRDVDLHRHPAFFGRVEDVIRDCCGFCPKPETEEEKKIAEEESKIYISGEVSFIQDDPGRQQIGSFNPSTDDDWTEMAYVGNTARLCQAIMDHDLEHVQDWLDQEGADPNRRDHTGRTPLHLAVTNSTPEIVQCLVDNGARLVARFADGRTALHFAAQRGNVEIVKILMDKSTANEAEEAEEKDQKDKDSDKSEDDESDDDGSEDNEPEDDGEMVDDEGSDNGAFSATTGSFVHVTDDDDASEDAALIDDNEEPDFYDINAISWDTPGSALHFAIVGGHAEVAKLLCQEYGADVLLPVKIYGYDDEPTAAMLTLVLAMVLPLKQATDMIAALLASGATSSQADVKGNTAFQRCVDRNATELVRLLLHLDKAGAARSINHICFPWGRMSPTNPLLAAITSGNHELISALLDAGAAPQIQFDTWAKAAAQESTIMQYQYGGNDQKFFKSSVEQPLIVALKSPSPGIALELLNRGADPDTQTQAYASYRRNDWDQPPVSIPENGLALIRSYLKKLRGFKGDNFGLTKPPKTMERPDVFLKTLPEDSWMHWATSTDIRTKTAEYNELLKTYEKKLEAHETRKGVTEKQAAIDERIKILETIEAKFLSLCKKLPMDIEEEVPLHRPYPVVEHTEDYEYTPSFNICRVSTTSQRQSYIELFEAAWRGDLETIKALTLTAQGADKNEPPLQIAVYDGNDSSPFSLAFLRGHYKVAAAILEIAQAQYAPRDEPNVRYALDANEEDSEDSGSDAEDNLAPYRMIVDDEQFTIENIGEVNMQVRSDVKPTAILCGTCQVFDLDDDGKAGRPLSCQLTPLEAVFRNNDQKGLKFLLHAMSHISRQKLTGNDDSEEADTYAISTSEFEYALAQGHTEMLAELIKQTGTGLPLEAMVKDTGIDMRVKPTYYQGLTVYGRKRTDWADAARGGMVRSSGLQISPLLHAAASGALETVEWFMSDAPLRCYLEFTQSKAAQSDARLNHLSQAPGGFEGTISRWLNKDRDLALLAAIACKDHDKVLPLVKYLVRAAPESVMARNASGFTPLLMAAYTGRTDVAAILVAAGADQTVRQANTYENLLHAALCFNPDAESLKGFLDVLDPEARAQMFCERTGHDDLYVGSTPLHSWVTKAVTFTDQGYGEDGAYKSLDDVLKVLRLLLKYSGGRELDLLDSSGNTLLHGLVKLDAEPAVIRTLLAADPSKKQHMLLHRENTVGITPAELARDRFVKEALVALPERPRFFASGMDTPSLLDRSSELFLPTDTESEPEPEPVPPEYAVFSKKQFREAARTLRLMDELCAKYPGKRHLASLLEATDVTKRISKSFEAERYPVKVVAKKDSNTDENGTYMLYLSSDLSQTAWKSSPTSRASKGTARCL